jgi:hypothetical protein
MLPPHRGKEALQVPKIRQGGRQLRSGLSFGVVGPGRGAGKRQVEEERPQMAQGLIRLGLGVVEEEG